LKSSHLFRQVFNSSSKAYFYKVTVIGYSIPFLIVVLNAALTVGYLDKQEEDPFLEENGIFLKRFAAAFIR